MRVLIRAWLLSGLFMPIMVGCSGDHGSGQLREWQPSDHQPPETESGGAAGVGGGTGDQGGDPTLRAAGTLYQAACSACHGPEGHGDGPGKPPGAQLPDFATAQYQDSHTDEQLAQVISQGRNMMPSFGTRIRPEGIAALVVYIRSLGGR